MHYQVVAKPRVSPEQWEYYPHWSPCQDKAAAERLAYYAAQSGYEAAILHSVAVEMLELIARKVVERQDSTLLPALRYLPGTKVATASGRNEYEVNTSFRLSPSLDPYAEGPERAELDRLRFALEVGPGGDVTVGETWRFQHVSFPTRIDVLSAWVRLRGRVEGGLAGGSRDGAGDGAGDGCEQPMSDQSLLH